MLLSPPLSSSLPSLLKGEVLAQRRALLWTHSQLCHDALGTVSGDEFSAQHRYLLLLHRQHHSILPGDHTSFDTESALTQLYVRLECADVTYNPHQLQRLALQSWLRILSPYRSSRSSPTSSLSFSSFLSDGLSEPESAAAYSIAASAFMFQMRAQTVLNSSSNAYFTRYTRLLLVEVLLHHYPQQQFGNAFHMSLTYEHAHARHDVNMEEQAIQVCSGLLDVVTSSNLQMALLMRSLRLQCVSNVTGYNDTANFRQNNTVTSDTPVIDHNASSGSHNTSDLHTSELANETATATATSSAFATESRGSIALFRDVNRDVNCSEIDHLNAVLYQLFAERSTFARQFSTFLRSGTLMSRLHYPQRWQMSCLPNWMVCSEAG